MNFENKGFTQVSNNSKWKSIIEDSFLLTNYYAITHPSQPNYIAEIAGDYFECVNDGACSMGYTTIVDLLEQQGLTWKAYMENYKMQSNGSCFMSNSNPYCRQHNPFLSFSSITSTGRCKNIVSEDVFQNDVISNTLPNYSFYSPNNNNNSHDQDLNFSGSYLIDWFQKWYYPYITTTWKDTLFMAIWDEDAKEENNHVVAILRHPCIPKGKTPENSPRYTHYSMLRFVEDNFNLGTLGRNDRTATSFAEEIICEEARPKGKLVCPANITVEIESEADSPIVNFDSPHYELLPQDVSETSGTENNQTIGSLSTDSSTETVDSGETPVGGFSVSSNSHDSEPANEDGSQKDPETQDSVVAAETPSQDSALSEDSSVETLASQQTDSTPISSTQTSVQESQITDQSVQVAETTEAEETTEAKTTEILITSQTETESIETTATANEDQTTASVGDSSISAQSTESIEPEQTQSTQESSAQTSIEAAQTSIEAAQTSTETTQTSTETVQTQDQETQLSSQSQDATSNTDSIQASEATTSTSETQTTVSTKGEPTLISGLTSGSKYPIGTTFNTYQMVDEEGISCECSFSVTVTVRNVTSVMSLDTQSQDGSDATPMTTSTTTTSTTPTTTTTTTTTSTTTTGAQTQPEDSAKEVKVDYPEKNEEKMATTDISRSSNNSNKDIYATLGVILPLLIITVVSLVGLWAYREKQKEKSRLIENWNQETVSDPTTPLRTSSSQQYNYSQV